MSPRALVLALVLLTLLPSAAFADVITDWNTEAIACVKGEKAFVVPASRALAMAQLAVYDAVNGITPIGRPYLFTKAPPPGASPEAAAAAASYRVLVTVYPQEQPQLDALLTKSLASVPDGPGKYNGVEYALQSADAMLAWRANDHSAQPMAYVPRHQPGYWEPTPPGYTAALVRQWQYVTPFAMTTPAQFRPDPPPAMHTEAYAQAVNEAAAIGGRTSTVRTAYQSETARFWADPMGTDTTAGRWNLIAQQVSEKRGYTLAQQARLFAVLNAALADAAIAAWDCKYQTDNWRPVTAIRHAHLDGNPLTQPDPTWESYITTPSFPEYISGHATFSGAAATVLAHEFGDGNGFTVSSYQPPAIVRTYHRFSDAAMEGAMSRLYGGIHYRFSSMTGLEVGRNVGEWAWRHIAVR